MKQQDNNTQPVQSLNQSTGEWTKGEIRVEPPRAGQDQTASLNIIGPNEDRYDWIASVHLQFTELRTIEEAKANAERIVYAWNNVDRLEESNRELIEFVKEINNDQYFHGGLSSSAFDKMIAILAKSKLT